MVITYEIIDAPEVSLELVEQQLLKKKLWQEVMGTGLRPRTIQQTVNVHIMYFLECIWNGEGIFEHVNCHTDGYQKFQANSDYCECLSADNAKLDTPMWFT